MNKSIRFISVILMGLISFQIYAYDFISDGIHYNILSETDRTVTVTGGNEYSESIVIPPKAIHNSKTYSVIKIGKSAFKGYRYLTSLTLSNSLTTIEEQAFWNCRSLTSLTLPNSLTTIGRSAFTYCFSLTSLTLPNSLTTIEENAFYSCNDLKRINMLCETPIECNPRFSEEALKNAILYIPIGTLAEYEKVDPWRNFWNIKEVNFAGINETEADDMSLRLIWNNGILSIEGIDENESITIYDMSGHVVHSGTEHNVEYLVPGIYIVKAGKRGTKFAVLE